VAVEERISFGALLRRYRAAAALSQAALADRAGLSRRGIADLERGVRNSPYGDTVRRLADALALQPVERAYLLAASRRPHLMSSVVPTSLPVEVSTLIGREREISELQLLLRSGRVLTLTGAAGIGKTRLALEVARRAAHEFVDGAAFVDLAPLTDPNLLPQAAAEALGVQERTHRLVLQALQDHLSARQLLLVLDNCEHLLEASATLTDTLVRTCPSVRIVATSREAMRIRGETVWLVPSLRSAEASE
jgi:transcriptional regulator with XRE-family HTH domain